MTASSTHVNYTISFWLYNNNFITTPFLSLYSCCLSFSCVDSFWSEPEADKAIPEGPATSAAAAAGRCRPQIQQRCGAFHSSSWCSHRPSRTRHRVPSHTAETSHSSQKASASEQPERDRTGWRCIWSEWSIRPGFRKSEDIWQRVSQSRLFVVTYICTCVSLL